MDDIRFQYNVPYDSNQWYVILTTKSHFYFNSETKKSYWQINDLDVDKLEFVKSINYDEIGLLTAKINGMDIESYTKRKEDDKRVAEAEMKEKEQEKEESVEEEEVEEEEVEEEEEEEDEEQEETAAHMDNDIVESLIAETIGQITKESPEPQAQTTGLDLGYSSEDSDDEEQDQEEAQTEVAEQESLEKEQESESESDADINEGLDLSLSDESSPEEFYKLLDTFKSQISLFDPWFLIESELISEFATHPEFYSIDESQREKFFDIWVKQQTTKEVTGKFPTPTQLYLKFLQSHKDELKKLYFPDFKNRFIEEDDYVAATSSLSSKQVENTFRSYKLFLDDFAQYEKAQKKQKSVKINLKKKKLDDFLQLHRSSISEAVAKSSNSSLPQPTASDSDFDNWANLCNHFDLPQPVCEDIVNYVVGDEKRYQSYYDVIKVCLL